MDSNKLRHITGDNSSILAIYTNSETHENTLKFWYIDHRLTQKTQEFQVIQSNHVKSLKMETPGDVFSCVKHEGEYSFSVVFAPASSNDQNFKLKGKKRKADMIQSPSTIWIKYQDSGDELFRRELASDLVSVSSMEGLMWFFYQDQISAWNIRYGTPVYSGPMKLNPLSLVVLRENDGNLVENDTDVSMLIFTANKNKISSTISKSLLNITKDRSISLIGSIGRGCEQMTSSLERTEGYPTVFDTLSNDMKTEISAILESIPTNDPGVIKSCQYKIKIQTSNVSFFRSVL